MHSDVPIAVVGLSLFVDFPFARQFARLFRDFGLKQSFDRHCSSRSLQLDPSRAIRDTQDRRDFARCSVLYCITCGRVLAGYNQFKYVPASSN